MTFLLKKLWFYQKLSQNNEISLYGKTNRDLGYKDEDIVQQGGDLGEGAVVVPKGFQVDLRIWEGDAWALPKVI